MTGQDITPELLERIRADFLRILGDAAPSSATYPAALDYADRVGDALAEAFRLHLSAETLPDGKMYWNIADRVIRPLLEEDQALVADAAAAVQQQLNQAAGLGLAAQRAELNKDRIDGILNKVCAAEHYEDVQWVLAEPVRTFSRMTVDDTLKANVQFQGRAGLRPRVVRRTTGSCCEWCSRLAGTYDYPDVPADVYRRHERCRCKVEYDPGDGRRQNVWSKQWADSSARQGRIRRIQKLSTAKEKDAIIKADKTISVHTIPKQAEPNSVIDHIGNENKVETRTFYGPDGYKKKEITNHDHGFPTKHPYGEHGEHAHDYEWDETGKLKNRTTREISPDERKENRDIL